MTRKFTKLSKQEIERRRLLSVKALDAFSRDELAREYQALCDAFYWKNGKCCAGCDHWASEAGYIGECTASPPVSGDAVVKSLGIDWSSYTPPPGQPFTAHDHVCGTFKDEFDWASLGEVYLKRIGARP